MGKTKHRRKNFHYGWYRYVWSAQGPWAVHTVEADLARCDLGLVVLRAEPRESGGRGHEAVTSMVSRRGSGVLAAVNADFYTPEGGTVGTEVVDGRVTAARSGPAIAWRPGGAPWMGTASVRPDSLVLGWSVHRRDGDLVGWRPFQDGKEKQKQQQQ